jgi:hypothetical protein
VRIGASHDTNGVRRTELGAAPRDGLVGVPDDARDRAERHAAVEVERLNNLEIQLVESLGSRHAVLESPYSQADQNRVSELPQATSCSSTPVSPTSDITPPKNH